MEFGVKPYRASEIEVLQSFKSLLLDLTIEVLPVDEPIAERAYQLRAKYPFLKGMDALQLAAALNSNCSEFITNDKQLAKISEISIRLLEKAD